MNRSPVNNFFYQSTQKVTGAEIREKGGRNFDADINDTNSMFAVH
jgi:hypothetical protein